MSIRSTHTYAILEVSATAYAEIRKGLSDAGHADQFFKDDGAEVIDMHGITLKSRTNVSELVSKAESARTRF
jgi:hypothetical protein